jgi:putative spermidine/putrescine transport system ATP-binding protein
MAGLHLERLSKSYGDVVAVADLSLEVNEGELVVLLGPSGCGKTTTLRMVAGFVDASQGRIVLGGRDITALPPYRRNCGLVFQNYALFPHLTVFENVAFGLRMRRRAEAEIQHRVGEALALVRLEGFDARMPRQLSGGQQQRVALARALVIQPDILLLDEPLSNLDAKLRQEVRLEIRQLQRKLGLTTMLVTHDQEEALSLADRLVVMEHGAIQQVGTQRELYERPANRFVAGFVGRTNFIDGALTASGIFRSRGGLEIRVNEGAAGAHDVLSLRPEKLRVTSDPFAADNCVPATVENAAYFGAYNEYQLRCAGGERLTVHASSGNGADELAIGNAAYVSWPAGAALLLSGATNSSNNDDNNAGFNDRTKEASR